MQLMILNEDEIIVEMIFSHDISNIWTVSLHFINNCISLFNFILNDDTYFKNIKSFFIILSWKSMCFAKLLTSDDQYLTYVRMMFAKKHFFVNNMYILQDFEIVEIVKIILFLQWSRVMLNHFFSSSDAAVKMTA